MGNINTVVNAILVSNKEKEELPSAEIVYDPGKAQQLLDYKINTERNAEKLSKAKSYAEEIESFKYVDKVISRNITFDLWSYGPINKKYTDIRCYVIYKSLANRCNETSVTVCCNFNIHTQLSDAWVHSPLRSKAEVTYNNKFFDILLKKFIKEGFDACLIIRESDYRYKFEHVGKIHSKKWMKISWKNNKKLAQKLEREMIRYVKNMLNEDNKGGNVIFKKKCIEGYDKIIKLSMNERRLKKNQVSISNFTSKYCKFNRYNNYGYIINEYISNNNKIKQLPEYKSPEQDTTEITKSILTKLVDDGFKCILNKKTGKLDVSWG